MKVLLTVALLVSAGGAGAQYPERPIRLVVPQAAGSATDNVARLLAPELGRQLGTNVVVENRPGGALTIGIDAVAKAAPDGYTIGQGPVGALAITRHMVAKLPYDIERDLQPVAVVTTGYMLLAVLPKAPFTSVGELIARMRAILRRTTRGPGDPTPEVFTIGQAKINMTTHTVARGSKSSPLSFYEVELLATRREDDDRDERIPAAQLLADLEPVRVGQHEVEQDRLRLLLPRE